VGLVLCVIAFSVALALSRRNLGKGLGWVLLVGCLSGWLRARVFDGFAHFIFDAALAGWYIQGFRLHLHPKGPGDQTLDGWALVLGGIPTLVFLASPFLGGQPLLVQLVGLRSSVLFVPTLVLATRFRSEDMRELSTWAGVSAVVATGFAVGEMVFGIEAFFPRNAASVGVYRAFAIAGSTFRIPSSFASAHLYGGTLVALIPVLWTRLENGWGSRAGTGFYLLCAASGPFLCSSRLPVLVLGAIVLTLALLGRRSPLATVSALGAALVIALTASSDDRFRRYESFGDEGVVTGRVQGSFNRDLLDVIADAPLGRGLASAAGTSIPYFLINDALPQEGMESELSRLALELGVLGLLAWVALAFRVLLHGAIAAKSTGATSDALMLVVVAATAATALIGVGAMSAIPGTLLLFLQIGWLSKRSVEATEKGSVESRHVLIGTHK